MGEGRPLPLSVALITLGDPGRLTGGYLYHRRMAEAAPRHGARLDFVSFPERPFPLALRDAPAVLRRARRTGADALVIDSIAAAFLGPWLALRPPGVPLVAMLHQSPGGVEHGPVRTRAQAALDRLAYRKTRLLLVASDSLAEHLAANGYPRGRLRVVPPGRDVAAASGAPVGDLRRTRLAATGRPGSRRAGSAPVRRGGRRAVLLCVANWFEHKGIHSLLDAFARLPADAATLHLAGDDQADPRYAARIRARLARPDLAGRVAVHGPLPLQQVAALYDASDIFVLPGMRETYGTVYGEAMAAGLPVVGWRAGNLPYLAEHEREGLLAEPGDVEGLAGALRRLIEDQALRARLGEAARRRALGRPTWEQSAALFFGAIREAIGAGTSS